MADESPTAKIPGDAIGDGTDLVAPAQALLQGLNLLGTPEELRSAKGFRAAFSGPPQSVAVIEAGATAVSKWWSAGLGAAAIALWGSVLEWWGGQPENIKWTTVAGAAFVTGALVLAIGYLVASDVRGRAAASVATIQARTRIAETLVVAAQEASGRSKAAAPVEVTPLPQGIRAQNHDAKAANEGDWTAVARERHQDGTVKYVLIKGSEEVTVPISRLTFG